MTVGGYSFSFLTAAMGFIAVIWLLSLLAAIVSRVPKKSKDLRRVDVFVLMMTLVFVTTWSIAILHKSKPANGSAPVQSCVLIEVGQTERKVREILGDPNEIRPEEELRGPGSDLWIYRSSRCVVHFLGETVISVE
jgi:hypothetical protein